MRQECSLAAIGSTFQCRLKRYAGPGAMLDQRRSTARILQIPPRRDVSSSGASDLLPFFVVLVHSESTAASGHLKHGAGQTAELIAEHSSWRERLRILRPAPRLALPRLVPASFAPLPAVVKPARYEIPTSDKYDDGLTELARYLSRPTPRLSVERRGLEHLLACHRNCSGAIGMGDLLFLHAFVSVLAPDRVVEIGTLSGFSAAVIADAVAQHERPESDSVVVDTIDLNERCLTDLTQLVGFEIPRLVPSLASRIRVHAGKDASHVDQIARPGKLELVFIDADHQHPRPTLDLIRVARFVRPGGWVIVHDIELGPLAERMRAAGVAVEHGAPAGAQWLFEAWPFEKVSGGNIGALRLPTDVKDLVPFALAMLRIPSELEPLPHRRTLEAFFAALVKLL
jgi:predicted O-methyltransferase YrrM